MYTGCQSVFVGLLQGPVDWDAYLYDFCLICLEDESKGLRCLRCERLSAATAGAAACSVIQYGSKTQEGSLARWFGTC